MVGALREKYVPGIFGRNILVLTSGSGFKCFTDVIKLSMCIFSIFENRDCKMSSNNKMEA